MILEFLALRVSLNRIRSFLDAKNDEMLTTDEKVFGYVAAISSTYSALENFAEELAFTFGKLSLGPPRVTADEAVKRMRQQYVQNSATMLSRNLGSGRYETISELAVAKSLASCLDESEEFDLLAEVLAYHSANLRLQSLVGLFKWGASNLPQDLGRSDALRAWTATGDLPEQQLTAEIEGELKDLVERRNEIAHRAIPDSILSSEQIRSKLDFVEHLGMGLVACLVDAYLRGARSTEQLPDFGPVAESYLGGSVIVISNLVSPISVGDAVAALGATSSRWGRVLELRMEDTAVGQAAAGSEVGIRLDFRCSSNARLHGIVDAVDVLLPAPERMFGDYGPLTI